MRLLFRFSIFDLRFLHLHENVHRRLQEPFGLVLHKNAKCALSQHSNGAPVEIVEPRRYRESCRRQTNDRISTNATTSVFLEEIRYSRIPPTRFDARSDRIDPRRFARALRTRQTVNRGNIIGRLRRHGDRARAERERQQPQLGGQSVSRVEALPQSRLPLRHRVERRRRGEQYVYADLARPHGRSLPYAPDPRNAHANRGARHLRQSIDSRPADD